MATRGGAFKAKVTSESQKNPDGTGFEAEAAGRGGASTAKAKRESQKNPNGTGFEAEAAAGTELVGLAGMAAASAMAQAAAPVPAAEAALWLRVVGGLAIKELHRSLLIARYNKAAAETMAAWTAEAEAAEDAEAEAAEAAAWQVEWCRIREVEEAARLG